MGVIADKLGQEHADRLSALFGGTCIWIPNDIARSNGALRRKCGDGLFTLLAFHFGGDRIYVPQADGKAGGPRGVTAGAVADLDRRGWSAPRIARHLGCSVRTVQAKRAAAK